MEYETYEHRLHFHGCSVVSYASKDFYGTIERRAEGNAGTWVVGGRNVDVTDKTRHGSLKSMTLFPSAPVSKSNMKEKL